MFMRSKVLLESRAMHTIQAELRVERKRKKISAVGSSACLCQPANIELQELRTGSEIAQRACIHSCNAEVFKRAQRFLQNNVILQKRNLSAFMASVYHLPSYKHPSIRDLGLRTSRRGSRLFTKLEMFYILGSKCSNTGMCTQLSQKCSAKLVPSVLGYTPSCSSRPHIVKERRLQSGRAFTLLEVLVRYPHWYTFRVWVC
jgi:hypothetical protein